MAFCEFFRNSAKFKAFYLVYRTILVEESSHFKSVGGYKGVHMTVLNR